MESIWIDYRANSAHEFLARAIRRLMSHRYNPADFEDADREAIRILTRLGTDAIVLALKENGFTHLASGQVI